MINYIVVLDVDPMKKTFRHEYFPRGFHYKKEALDMVSEVVEAGGQAHLVPKSQFTPELLRKVRG